MFAQTLGFAVLVIMGIVMPLLSQPVPEKAVFETASIKANLRQLPAGNTGNLLPFPGGRLNAEGALLSFIIQLESAKGSVEVRVIDSIQRPSEN
jgi:hypothetical protein